MEKCVNWNMIKSFEPPIYLEGDLVTYQYKPAIIQKAYLRDDTYSLRYEGEEDHTVGSSYVESKQNVSKFVEKIKWVYLQKRTGVSLGMNNKQGSEVLGRLVVGDAVEFGCRGSRKAGVVIKKNYDENVDEVVDGKILYDIEGEDGVIHKDVSSRHIRRFEPTKFKINDTVLVEKEDVRLAGQVDYEEGVVVKIHAQENTYDVKIIEAEFVAQWSQGVEYRQTQWGRKASPFDKKTNTSASSANFSISLFDDSFSSSLAKSPLPLTLPSSSLLPTSPDSSIPGELPSGSLFATSPAVATSPLPSSLSLGDMHEFSMASSCIPSMDQDKILKVTSIIKGKLTPGNFIAGIGIVDGTWISPSDSAFNDSVVRVTGGCGYYKMSTCQKQSGIERKLQAYSYRKNVSWHKMRSHRPVRAYNVNDAVEALSTCDRYSKDPLLFSANLDQRVWLPGIVTKVLGGNTYNVEYTNLRKEEGVMAVDMRSINAPVFVVHESVHVRCMRKDKFSKRMVSGMEEGKILKSNYDNTHDVLYSATGQVEKSVSWHRISKVSKPSMKPTKASKKVFEESEDCQVLVPLKSQWVGDKGNKGGGSSEWMDGVVVSRTKVNENATNDLNTRVRSDLGHRDNMNFSKCNKYRYEVKLLSSGEILKVPDAHGAIDIRESLLIFSFSDLLKIT